MEEIKLTITVQKPSGYTSTKTVVISEEVFIQVEELTTSNTDLLEKAKREAEPTQAQLAKEVFDLANKLAIKGFGNDAVIMHRIHNKLAFSK